MYQRSLDRSWAGNDESSYTDRGEAEVSESQMREELNVLPETYDIKGIRSPAIRPAHCNALVLKPLYYETFVIIITGTFPPEKLENFGLKIAISSPVTDACYDIGVANFRLKQFLNDGGAP